MPTLLALAAALALAAPPTRLNLTITDRKGDTWRGLADIDALTLTTSYGSATVLASQIATADLGAADVVTTLDGTELSGHLELPAVTLVSPADAKTLVRLERDQIVSLVVVHDAPLIAGQVTDGLAPGRLTYHLRAPEGFTPGATYPAIVILHGSNMNSRDYLSTMVQAWPALAKGHILIGINGEQRSPASEPGHAAFNYTYVNFVGKSRYKGYPGSDHESPALVAALLKDLRGRLPLTSVLVGGHSQGAFLTYSILMNYPDLVDGVFPVSGGLIIQCEPEAYDNAAHQALQRNVPIAIVHGTSDPTVSFGMSQHANDVLLDAGFPAVRMFTSPDAGHRFAMLPVEDAVRWLESFQSDGPGLAAAAAGAAREGDTRTALALLARLATKDPANPERAALEATIDRAAQQEAPGLLKSIREAKGPQWVPAFRRYRAKFEGSASAKPVIDAYLELRAAHQPLAQRAFEQAQECFQNGNEPGGFAAFEQITAKYYASTLYDMAAKAIADRAPTR